ncbi:fused MFS/spermidine synthase [Paenibacillus sp. N1-5-1-14]|uniref:spermidine synthase n=1 Tax=Paenibacillus radicibacter TaxID=2972488 RepID=UPI002159130D|nr:fused MFS/spermidine synthase [Paenibacillus radicibacter]MCR8643155.1 fused MFS/spermidine synthase [Paenibacillus radicibacter]
MSNPLRIGFLYFYVFVTGASVMAIEIAASRFLAPYFGTSMIVWANIIGLCLLSLAIGYFVGGRWADKWPSGKLLMMLTLLSGTFVALLPLWGDLIFPLLSKGIMNTPVWVIFCSFFAVLIVFAPPIFLLAMVSPFAIRLLSGQTSDLGKVAGNLYACSTLGSLVGTFGTAMLTIPFIGAKESIYIWSAALILVSSWGLRQWGKSWLAILVIIPLLSYYLTSGNMTMAAGEKVLWSGDTFYQFVKVTEDRQGDISLVYNEGGGIQSIKRATNALNSNDYYNDYLSLPFLVDKPRELLILGSAGGTIASSLGQYVKPQLPDLKVTGVEIDPAVVQLSYDYFGLKQEDAEIVSQDARVFINNANKKYDITIVDCYSNQIYIPAHLSTVEFFKTLKEHTTDQGLVALNINATTPDSKLLTSMIKTIDAVFPYTYMIKSSGINNYMVIGALHELDVNDLSKIDKNSPLQKLDLSRWDQMKRVEKGQYNSALLLTDNHAPTEMLTDSMIFNFITDSK